MFESQELNPHPEPLFPLRTGCELCLPKADSLYWNWQGQVKNGLLLLLLLGFSC